MKSRNHRAKSIRLFQQLAAYILGVVLSVSPTLAKEESTERVEGPHDVDLFQVEPTVIGEGSHDLPLHLYVTRPFEGVAQFIEVGDANKALSLLKRKMKTSHGLVLPESHYLRALCLQSLKQYSESCTEYLLVEKYSSDTALIRKAEQGYIQSTARQPISHEQLNFPRISFVPDIRPSKTSKTRAK